MIDYLLINVKDFGKIIFRAVFIEIYVTSDKLVYYCLMGEWCGGIFKWVKLVTKKHMM